MSTDLIDMFYKPFEYKSLKLRNRLAMAPMTRYFSPDGTVTPDVAEYYARRARGGVGLIMTEALSPDREVARNHENIPWFQGERRDP